MPGLRAYEQRARRSLRFFRQGSLLAIAFAALLLMLLQPVNGAVFLDTPTLAAPQAAEQPAGTAPADPAAAAQEATGTLRDLLVRAYALWPKLAIAALILLLGWALSAVLAFLLRHLLRNWAKAEAMGAFTRVMIFLVALGVALSIIAGDARALVGSVGLFGLALSWALQAPIESFTGWLLNSFKGYYRVGDRIAVGEVFGDVYQIDILTTMVWESGGPDKSVQGAQPTGALITFPNSEVLRNNIVNYTRDFPYVWDEIVVGLSEESDLAYAMAVIDRVAGEVIGSAMAQAAEAYRLLLERQRLLFEVAVTPQVYLAPADSMVNVTIRYVVAARERRRWASELFLAVATEIGRPEHRGRIITATPRLRVELPAKKGGYDSSKFPSG